MTWYYLIRGAQVINEIRCDNVFEAAEAFNKCSVRPAKLGDKIMCCALKAEPPDDFTWRAA